MWSVSHRMTSGDAATSFVRARSQRSVQPFTCRARYPSGLPSVSRPAALGSTAWKSASVSIITWESLRFATGSLPPPNSGGTSRRTTVPRRRSMTKNGLPMTLASSQ